MRCKELDLLSGEMCCTGFTSPVWFTSDCTVRGLPSAHKVLTQRAEAVVEVVAAAGFLGVSKKKKKKKCARHLSSMLFEFSKNDIIPVLDPPRMYTFEDPTHTKRHF